MRRLYLTLISLSWTCSSLAFQRALFPFKLQTSSVKLASSDHDGDEEVRYNSIAISGFISKENNFVEPFVLSKLFKTGKWSDMTTLTDDVKFARKRLMSPDIVNSGLTNVLKFAEVDKSDSSLENALAGKEAWLCFNVTSTELPIYAAVAAKVGLKRAIFAVNVSPDDSGAGVTFDAAASILATAKIAYTIIKYGPVRKMGEAKYPYRIARGESALPTEGRDMLASDDLMRVLVEIVDIPKTFNTCYGIGPGTRLDSEISVYMKSQGWPDRVQISLLLGDFMEKLQVRYDEEVILKAEKDSLAKVAKKKSASALPAEGEGNKYAGFF